MDSKTLCEGCIEELQQARKCSQQLGRRTFFKAVGAATGLIGLLNLSGSMLAPWLFGVILDTYGTAPGDGGYDVAWVMLAAFAVAGFAAGVVCWALRRRGHLRPRA